MTNSATLKTIRETVGLTVQAAADLAGVTLRTWQRWEAPDYTGHIPDDVTALLDALLARLTESVDAALEAADAFDGAPLRITRYRTQTALDHAHPGFQGGINAHSAIIGAILAASRAEGHAATVHWDDDPTALNAAD